MGFTVELSFDYQVLNALLLDFSDTEIGELLYKVLMYEAYDIRPRFNDRGMLAMFRIITGCLEGGELGAKEEGG